MSLPLIVGVTGASGAIYASRLLQALRALGVPSHLIMSGSALKVAPFEGFSRLDLSADQLFDDSDLFAPPASGSARYLGMVIAPCSMGTLGRIAAGVSDTLLTRAADVQLKEGRPLILLPREAPLSAIHLENMLRVNRAGGTILPASPFFYTRPKTLEEAVDGVIGKVLDRLGIDHNLTPRWNGGKEE